MQPNEIRSTYRLYSNLGNTLEVVLYDAVPGGAGYCSRLASAQFSVTKLLQQMRSRLDCPRECDSGCRACLCDYGNQRHWDSFQRREALAWLVATMEGKVTGAGAGSYLPWTTPSLAGLAERFAPQPYVSLVGTTLCSPEGYQEADLLQVKQWLDSDKKVRIYIAGHVESHPRDLATLTLYRHIYPYIIDGRLKVLTIEVLSNRAAAELPRIFGTLEAGAPLVRQAFPIQPLFSGLIGEPAFLGAMDDSIATVVRVLNDKAKVCTPEVFAEGTSMRMWEFAANQARDLADLFAAVKGEHVAEVVIRDPYCGASNNRIRVEQLVAFMVSFASRVDSVKVHAVETKDRSGNIEHRYDVARSLEQLIQHAGVAQCEATVMSYGSGGRTFHDRDVTLTVKRTDGTTAVHRYFLTGGVDYVMDRRSATRVFYTSLST